MLGPILFNSRNLRILAYDENPYITTVKSFIGFGPLSVGHKAATSALV
jgi:hypothetical protein